MELETRFSWSGGGVCYHGLLLRREGMARDGKFAQRPHGKNPNGYTQTHWERCLSACSVS